MSGKPRPILIEKYQFPIYLAARMPTLGGSVQAMAEDLDVSIAAMYALLAGTLQPSDEMLEKVGLRALYVVAVTLPKGDPPIISVTPPKGKKPHG